MKRQRNWRQHISNSKPSCSQCSCQPRQKVPPLHVEAYSGQCTNKTTASLQGTKTNQCRVAVVTPSKCSTRTRLRLQKVLLEFLPQCFSRLEDFQFSMCYQFFILSSWLFTEKVSLRNTFQDMAKILISLSTTVLCIWQKKKSFQKNDSTVCNRLINLSVSAKVFTK